MWRSMSRTSLSEVADRGIGGTGKMEVGVNGIFWDFCHNFDCFISLRLLSSFYKPFYTIIFINFRNRKQFRASNNLEVKNQSEWITEFLPGIASWHRPVRPSLRDHWSRTVGHYWTQDTRWTWKAGSLRCSRLHQWDWVITAGWRKFSQDLRINVALIRIKRIASKIAEILLMK